MNLRPSIPFHTPRALISGVRPTSILLLSLRGIRGWLVSCFFTGDPKQDIDRLFHQSLAVPVVKKRVNGKEYETAVFDIVLETDKK